MGLIKNFALGIGAVVVAAGAYDLATFDRAAWQADYAAIKRGMAQHYANLDWLVDHRGFDVAALDRRTDDRLAAAHSHLQAFLALKQFAEAFGDPHLRLAPGRDPAAPNAAGEAADPPAGDGCEAAGYAVGDAAFAPRMAALPGWRQLGGAPFPAAIAGSIGVVRIASFSERQYRAACQQAYSPGIGERALQLATRARLQQDLAATIARLKAAGARTMLVDLSGNGGGSEWAREAAGLFTARVMTRTEPQLADAPCDRSGVWRGKRPCPVFAVAGTGTARIQGTGQWTGPVAILADPATASASEEFIGWLVDNRVARLVGARTAGAGCGYVDGGKPVVLAAAPLTLRMPNCARYAASGVNEIEGWVPTFPLDPPAEGSEAPWAKQLAGFVGG